MQDEPNKIVGSSRGGKGAVAAFVGKDPDACHDHPGNHGIEGVYHRAEGNAWDRRCIGVRYPGQATK